MRNLRKVFLTLAMAAVATTAWAQQIGVTVETVGAPQNTMVKVCEERKFLLLPIEESAPECDIRLLVDAQVAKTFNAHLALDRVDYYVPVELDRYKGHKILLDVFSHDNNLHMQASQWKSLITLADEFDTTNKEQWRPAFHHTPVYGWMNDPNGMFSAPKLLQEVGLPLEEAAFATSLYFIFRTIGCFTGSIILQRIALKNFFIISVVMMAASMACMFIGGSAMMLYIGIALVGYGNSNIFSMCFSQALNAMPEKQNEVSGLMIMGLFGGTVFPLAMGLASDAIGQAGAVAVMTIGVAYLLVYYFNIKK